MCLGVLQSGQCLHHVPLEQNAIPAPYPQHSIALSIRPSVHRFCTQSASAPLPTTHLQHRQPSIVKGHHAFILVHC